MKYLVSIEIDIDDEAVKLGLTSTDFHNWDWTELIGDPARFMAVKEIGYDYNIS